MKWSKSHVFWYLYMEILGYTPECSSNQANVSSYVSSASPWGFLSLLNFNKAKKKKQKTKICELNIVKC